MIPLLWGGLGTGLGFLVHLLVWRVRLPRRQTRALLAIFLSTLGVLLGGAALAAAPPMDLAGTFQAALLGLALTLAYVITYSAIEAESPSLVIVLAIHRAGPEGLPEARLREALDDRVLVDPRLDDLLRDRLAEERDGRFRLTPKGRRFFAPFRLFRRLLGAGKGG